MTLSEENPTPVFWKVSPHGPLGAGLGRGSWVSTWHIMVLLAQVQNRGTIPGFGGLLLSSPFGLLLSPVPFLHFFFLFSKENSGRRQSPIGVSNFYKNRFGLERPALEFPAGKQKWQVRGPSPFDSLVLGFVCFVLFCFYRFTNGILKKTHGVRPAPRR